jgi:hypothetical protein
MPNWPVPRKGIRCIRPLYPAAAHEQTIAGKPFVTMMDEAI